MRAVVAGGEVQQINEARRILLSEGLTCEAEDAVGYDRLQDSLAATHPDIVLVYCNAAGGEGLAAVRAAHHLVAGAVLAVGQPDVALMREAVRAGAGEFLDVNNLRRDLAAALATVRTARPAASKRGQIITVFSPLGGGGASTIALNLAVSLAKIHAPAGGGKSSPPQDDGVVALVDVTPPPSDLALLLDLDPRHTLADVLCHRDRLDRRLLAGAMTPHASGLHVLPQAGFTDDLRVPEFDLDPPLVRQMFVLLRTSYELVVVDLGHAFSPAQVEAFRLSNVVVLPAVADVPGLRRVRWALDTAESMGISRERFQIVLNRYGGKNQVARSKVEDALHTSILTTIADHGPLLTTARNEGQPAVELSGGVAKEFQALAKAIEHHLAGGQA
jgi:pilus assembly protein CpaE